MAEDASVGRKLLDGIVEVKLDEVLTQLRGLAKSEGHSEGRNTRSSIIDRLLSSDHAPQQAQHRLPVLEICSEDTAAGKSQLVYLLLAVAMLPATYGQVFLDGKNGAVVFIDTESRFNVQRLAQVTASYIRSKANLSSQEIPSAEVDQLVERSLRHVHVYQPQSMPALLETLSGVKTYLFDSSAHQSSQRAVHSIMVDSGSAFYWQLRAEIEDERVAALNAKAPGLSSLAMPPTKPNQYATLVSRLRSLQKTFHCGIIATTTAIVSRDQQTGEKTLRTLPAPWSTFPTLRVVVKRDEVRKFAPGTSWEDAVKDRALRQKVVEKGVFSATVLGKDDSFKFAITRDAVRIIDNDTEEDD